MTFKKGQSGNPKGREKGVGNKSTEEFKKKLNDLLEESAPKMAGQLEQIALDSPEKAFDILSKFTEYIHPKLARTEQQQLGKDGKPTDAHICTLEVVDVVLPQKEQKNEQTSTDT